MVRHQTVGPYFYLASPTPLFHQINICRIVLIPEEGGHSSIPTLGDVVGYTCCCDSRNSGHMLMAMYIDSQIKHN